jgi:stage III sporulation protein AA
VDFDRLIRLLPERLRGAAAVCLQSDPAVREIRIRAGSPLIVQSSVYEAFLRPNGKTSFSPAAAYTVTPEDCRAFFRNITGCSMYALERQLTELFITVEGGIRIGLSGSASVENGRIKIVKDCMSFNIRIPRAVVGCAKGIIEYIAGPEHVYTTLIISPPGAGKTTLLRDIARMISNGEGFRARNVAIVDERSEIAACVGGVPQFDVGIRTDVLDNCPKSEGIRKLIRVMAPDVLVTDELGAGDSEAVIDATNSGVSIIASAHASSIAEVAKRQEFEKLLENRVFKRFVVLSKRLGPGTVEAVYNGSNALICGYTGLGRMAQ